MAPQPGFFDKHMDTVDTCSICLEPFGPSHPPARLNVDGDPCKHIFGAPCLREWVMADSWNSNRCPVCRTRMFYYSDEDETGDENSDEDGDEEISDAEVSDEEVSDEEVSDEEVSDDSSDDGSAVSEVEEMQDAPVTDEPNENVVLFENMSRGTVRCFVLNLYNEVCDVDYAVLGTENDFEDKFMVKCMTRACQEVGLGDDFSIRIVDIPKVRRVVMRMVRRHKGAGLTFEQWHYWTMEMQRAVKWQHGDVAAPEDDARVVYGPLTQAQTIYQQWQARKREEEAAARNREAAAQARLAVWQPGRPF